MADQPPHNPSASPPKTPAPDSFPKLPQSIFNMEKRDGGGPVETKKGG